MERNKTISISIEQIQTSINRKPIQTYPPKLNYTTFSYHGVHIQDSIV